ncbi:MAG TPA: hypothetical protein VGS41_05205 [Chthonomonadales bacterium]|nr:hypothetical protein [Chthonomonadales bacterium]
MLRVQLPFDSRKPVEARSCEHCGALVYSDSRQCPQCSRFPIKLHECRHCHTISGAQEEKCHRCGRAFEPDGDYL